MCVGLSTGQVMPPFYHTIHYRLSILFCCMLKKILENTFDIFSMVSFSGHFAGGALLFFGTISSVTAKLQLLVKSKGWLGIEHDFEKPGVQVFFMFLGMFLAFPLSKLIYKNNASKNKKYTTKQKLYPIFSSTSGTIAVYINTLGLERVNASIYMMLRGCLTIFSSLFSVIFLHKRLKKYQWLGIVFTILSLVIVGFAGVQMGSDESKYGWKDRLLGVFSIIIAQVMQGGQLVWDEYMLQSCGLDAMYTVGMEGLYGIILSILIVVPLTFIIPGKDPSPLGGSFENAIDSCLMLFNSWALVGYTLLSTLAICGYDISGMTVTASLSSVHRTIYEALRTLTTWIVMLVIYWCGSSMGEKWVSWSWLELGGFVLLIFATLMFNHVISFPCLEDNQLDEKEQ